MSKTGVARFAYIPSVGRLSRLTPFALLHILQRDQAPQPDWRNVFAELPVFAPLPGSPGSSPGGSARRVAGRLPAHAAQPPGHAPYCREHTGQPEPCTHRDLRADANPDPVADVHTAAHPHPQPYGHRHPRWTHP